MSVSSGFSIARTCEYTRSAVMATCLAGWPSLIDLLNSARPSLRSTEEYAIDRRSAADLHPKWKRRHVRSGKISSRNPQLAGGQLPAGDAAADDLGGRYVLGRPQHQVLIRAAARLVRADARQGLDRPALAKGIWRRRPRSGTDKNRAPGNGGARRAPAADLVRHFHARAGAIEIRHRCAEEGTSAEDISRAHSLVPGLFRAERRIGPCIAADPRRKRWR